MVLAGGGHGDADELSGATRLMGDFLAYLRFKLPLLSPGAQYGKGLPEAVVRRASESLRLRVRVTVQKDDALFVCGGPHGP